MGLDVWFSRSGGQGARWSKLARAGLLIEAMSLGYEWGPTFDDAEEAREKCLRLLLAEASGVSRLLSPHQGDSRSQRLCVCGCCSCCRRRLSTEAVENGSNEIGGLWISGVRGLGGEGSAIEATSFTIS